MIVKVILAIFMRASAQHPPSNLSPRARADALLQRSIEELAWRELAAHPDGLGTGGAPGQRPAVLTQQRSLVVARKLTTAREILLWMTPSEAPKALQTSECSDLLDPMRASCWIFAQH